MGNAREKQLGAWLLCGFSVVAILFLSRGDWRAVIAVMVGVGLVTVFGKPMIREQPTAMEKILGTGLFLWNIVVLGKLGWELSKIHGVTNPMPGMILLILGGYGTKKKVHPVISGVLVFFLLGIYGMLYLFALPELKAENLLTKGQGELSGIAYGFLPMLLLYMYKDISGKKRSYWILGCGIVAIGTAVITEGMGLPDFYSASMSVNIFGAMERLEPFVASAVTAGGFCLIGFLLVVNETVWNEVWERKKNFPVEWIILLSGAGILGASVLTERMYTVGTTLCWGLVPVLTQLIVYRKKE